MARKQTPAQQMAARTLRFKYHSKQVQVILDKVLVFQFLRRLHGRFWGAAGLLIMLAGFGVCFVIRPETLHADAALSDFGTDIRTAPYFAGAMFFGAYGLWRWRRYLMRTLKRKRPISWLTMLTILGLYIVALVPESWNVTAYHIHIFGMSLAGISMAATVVADSLLSRTQRTQHRSYWRFLRFLAFMLIVVGGYITLGSSKLLGWFDVVMLGELMMIAGYGTWIYIKTYLGEGNRSQLDKILHRIVLID
jgi:multisubunit Na+/H+ antiporter MnhG subunit